MSLFYKVCFILTFLTYAPFFKEYSILLNSSLLFLFILSILKSAGKVKVPDFVRFLLLSFSLGVIFFEFGTFKGIGPGIVFLPFLAVLKTFEMPERRDFFLFILIIELTLAGNLLRVDDLYMVIYIVFFSLALFAILFFFHHDQKNLKWTKERTWILGKIFLISLPFAIVLFVFFPRIKIGNIFLNTVKVRGRVGFSDKLRPGSISGLILNKDPVFRAFFKNGKRPSQNELYWRGAVLAKADGLFWDLGPSPHIASEFFEEEDLFSYRIDYDSFEAGPLFLLRGSSRPRRLSKGHLATYPGGTYRMAPFSNQKIRVETTVKKKSGIKLTKFIRKTYLELPENRFSRFRSWALSFNEEKRLSPLSAYKYFQKEIKEKFSYSLNPGVLKKSGALDHFFFETRIGFCEHFASSLAIFFRVLNIPSRVVVGYQGGTRNPIGDYYLIRKRDAHAWVEAWDKKEGWIKFDPTLDIAPERIELGADIFYSDLRKKDGENTEDFLKRARSGIVGRALFALDMFYYELNSSFINYDLEGQRNSFSFLGKKGELTWRLIGLLILVAFLSFFLMNRHLLKMNQKSKDVDLCFELFLKKLKKVGIDYKRGEGPLSFQNKLKARPHCCEIMDDYIQLKYANSTKKDHLESFQRKVRELSLKEE